MSNKKAKASEVKSTAPRTAGLEASEPTRRKVVEFQEADDPETARAYAEMALRPSVNAAAVLKAYTAPLGEQDLAALAATLADDMTPMWSGDMRRAEAMLFAQAHALQAMFMNLTRRATSQEYQKNFESFFRMGMKAQSQCRMTLETLALLKNPPVVIAKQANINNGGQQQVNNGAPLAPATPQAGGGPQSLDRREVEPSPISTHGKFSDLNANQSAPR